MKRIVMALALMVCSTTMYSQTVADSLQSILKGFRLSLSAGYNYLLPSVTKYDRQSNLFSFYYAIGSSDINSFSHNQWYLSGAAEGNKVKWALALKRDYLNYDSPGASFEADYLRTSLSLQLFLWKKSSMQILFGPSLELGWITRYVYSSDDIALRDPDIGQTTGIDLLFPLTLLFPIAEHSRISINVAGGVRLRDDHQLPYMNHWGYGPGQEGRLLSCCPFSIGIGYGYIFSVASDL